MEHELDINYLLTAKSLYKKPPLQQENNNHFQPHIKQEDLLVLDARRGAMAGHARELSHRGGFRVYSEGLLLTTPFHGIYPSKKSQRYT